MTSPSEPSAPQCPPSPGRAITKTSSEERERLHMESVNNRPASLDLAAAAAARQRPPHFPGAAPPSHTNPLIYLQNNNMAGHINPAMLNQVGQLCLKLHPKTISLHRRQQWRSNSWPQQI